MCGICGVRRFDGGPVEEGVLRAMRDVMAHRGPDDEGLYLSEGVGLGHRRLSVIDLATGHQPMFNENGTVCIVFNGEIYNHLDVRTELERLGHRYITRSDTESIIHAYEEDGTACVHRLNGMFAFAIWDARAHILFLARDRTGMKPLYYWVDAEKFVFASEIKSILEYPGMPRELDMDGLNLYLALQYVPAPWTLFKGVRKLPPGHFLVCHADGRVKIEKYWDVTYGSEDDKGEAFYIEGIRERVLRAVERRLISDVPLGAFLSGGVDSSTVVGLMSRIMNRPVDTYVVGFDLGEGSPKFNVDREHARLAARHFGTNHHEVVISQSDRIADVLPALVRQMDEPISNPTAISTYFVSRLARQTVTVALSGDGADEIFGGYYRYVYDRVVSRYEAIPTPLREGIMRLLVLGLPFPRQVKQLAHKASLGHTPARYLTWWTVFTLGDRVQLFNSALSDQVSDGALERLVMSCLDNVSSRSFQDKLAYTDLKLWIADQSNMVVDKMSMLVSLETRSPFQDYELVEFAGSIPFKYKVRGRTMKVLFKRVFRDLLPPEILSRSKHGFQSPGSYWLRNDLRELVLDVLSRGRIEQGGLFNPDYVERIVTRHLNREEYNLNKVWTLLTFQLWYDAYLGEGGA